MGLIGSNATTAMRPSEGSSSARWACSAASAATSVLLPAPGDPVRPITRRGRRRRAPSRTGWPLCTSEMSRASWAVGCSLIVADRSITSPRIASTMSFSPVPVGKHRRTPISLSLGMSSTGRIPPMCTGRSGRPTVARPSISLGPRTRWELLIIDAAIRSQSSSRAEIDRLRGVCHSPE